MERKQNKQNCSRFGFINPSSILAVVVSLIILAVGVFVFFVTLNQIDESLNSSESQNVTKNITSGTEGLFGIVGIVLIIGAIMAVVGLVYKYIEYPISSRRSYDYDDELELEIEKKKDTKKPEIVEDKKVEKKNKKFEKRKKEGWQI